MTYLYIMAGAVVGAPARYFVQRGMADVVGVRFPYGTVLVNLTGCFLIGVIGTLAVERGALSREARLLLVTGFLGSFTTFSAFGLETYDLLHHNDLLRAGANVLVSMGGGLAAVWIGAMAARLFW